MGGQGDLCEEVVSEHRCLRQTAEHPRGDILGREDSKCQGPEAGLGLMRWSTERLKIREQLGED